MYHDLQLDLGEASCIISSHVDYCLSPLLVPLLKIYLACDRLDSFIVTSSASVRGSLEALFIVCPGLSTDRNGCHAGDLRFCV